MPRFLKKLFGSSTDDSQDSSADDGIEYFTYGQALAFANEQALRELTASDSSIYYIAHVASMHDYCFCEWIKQDEGWVMTVRGLTNQERLPQEQITDDQILTLFREGNRISAVRLYRTREEVGLKEAMDAIEQMLSD
ncbi:MAG: hypothetical protein AAGB26_02985 [Planctomycetota bacterium]